MLAVALAVLYRLARRDVRAFARFRAIEDGAGRQRALLRWALFAFLAFLLMPLAGLALLDRLDALFEFPEEFAALRPDAPVLPVLSPGLVGRLLIAILIGGTIGGLLIAFRRRRGSNRASVPHIDAMTPRSPGETVAIALLSANAAISEEVLFRLYLPLLLTMLGVPPLAAFVAVTLLFGLVHRYQGRLGVIVTGLLGTAFAFFYCAGMDLGWPILLHLLINLNALLLRPFVARLAAPRAD